MKPRLVDAMIARVVNMADEFDETFEEAAHYVADNLFDDGVNYSMIEMLGLPPTKESVEQLFAALDVATERLTGENPGFAE